MGNFYLFVFVCLFVFFAGLKAAAKREGCNYQLAENIPASDSGGA